MFSNHEFRALLCLTVLYSVRAQTQNIVPCSANITIINVDNTYIWPNNTILAANQNCTYEINYNSSTYLTFILDAANLQEGDRIYISDAYGASIKSAVRDSVNLATNFAPARIVVSFTTGPSSNMSLTWSMTATKFSIGHPNQAEVMTTDVPKVLTSFQPNTTYTINAASKAVLSIVLNPSSFGLPYWMGIFIYDGSGSNATLLGSIQTKIDSKETNLSWLIQKVTPPLALIGHIMVPNRARGQAHDSVYNLQNRNIVSAGKTLTIYSTFGLDLTGSIVLVNDFSNVKGFASYTTSWGYSPFVNGISIAMNATAGPAALIVGNLYADQATYLKGITVSDPSASLNVIAGPPNSLPDYHITTYIGRTIDDSMPQQFTGILRTFVLDKGTAELNFQRLSHDANWNVVRANRSGFMMSNNFPFESSNQSISFSLSSSKGNTGDRFEFVFDVTKSDKLNNREDHLSVLVTDYNSQPFYSEKPANLTGVRVALTGQSALFGLDHPSNITSRGSLISFKMTKAPSKSAGLQRVFTGSILLALWMLL